MTRLNAFANGVSGIFLSFIGMGTIPSLFWYFENLQTMLGGVSGETAIIIGMFVLPAIILVIGSTSFYYGIKILQNNNR